MKKNISIILFLTIISLLFINCSKDNKQGLVALYHFEEGVGDSVFDSSGKKNHGVIHEVSKRVNGIRGKALSFVGHNSVRVKHSATLDLKNEVSIVAWINGNAIQFELIEETSGLPLKRGPYFQVCGDKIFFTLSSDHPDSAGKKWIDWHMWMGTVDINLKNWRDKKITESPLSGLEPKLQVVNTKIYYEYFGQDMNKVWQIWTAQSNIDGTDWQKIQRTDQKEGYRVEQGNLQVKNGKIYYGYTQRDEKNVWQLWTASSNLDGSGWKSVQRTTNGGWIPQLQIVEDKIYYIYFSSYNIINPKDNKMYFAESNIDGTGWKIIKKIDRDFGDTLGFFHIDKNKIYFSYSEKDEKKIPQLWTCSMNKDGTNFQAIQRTFGNYPTYSAAMQVVGDKIYYVVIHTENTERLSERNFGIFGYKYWTAQSNIDGSGWRVVKRIDVTHDCVFGYKPLQVVGGKVYYSGYSFYSMSDGRAMMGASGSNIINKGDAYGTGLTEDNEARGFINAGQDYLFRGEAPADTAGAIADYSIDNNWHYLVMTYDRKELKLYVDGKIRSSVLYNSSIGSNPFPLIIGDHFEGIIDEVAIYNRALSAREIMDKYRKYY